MNFECNIFLHLQQLLGMYIELPILGLGFYPHPLGNAIDDGMSDPKITRKFELM
jgi:hypothetical protein